MFISITLIKYIPSQSNNLHKNAKIITKYKLYVKMISLRHTQYVGKKCK